MQRIRVQNYDNYDVLRAFPSEREDRINRIKSIKKIQKNTKPLEIARCYYCQKSFSGKDHVSKCNSHSLPRHILAQLSTSGRIKDLNSVIGLGDVLGEPGISQAGTFKLICRDCDSMVFRDYENFSNYTVDMFSPSKYFFSQNILNQIVMKNYFRSLYSTLNTENRFRQYAEQLGITYFPEYLTVFEQEIKDHTHQLEHVIRLSQESLIKQYEIGYFQILDKKLPFAVQASFAPRTGFHGEVINDSFNLTEKIHQLHVCIFPDKSSTIILLFRNKKDERVKPLFRYINNLDKNSALKAIIALSIKYTENFFISDSLDTDALSIEYLQRLASDDGTMRFNFESDLPIPSMPQEGINFLRSHLEYNYLKDYQQIPDQLIDGI